MSTDLKTMLPAVLKSSGKRKFFFAYGGGKRTDGNGDGHLIVDIKKPKKPEVQAACACQPFFEGCCWSSLDGEVVYFQSKGSKLGTATIAKMALTAKKLAGRSVDFQIPSPEEESRANSLGEGEGTEQQGESAPPEAVPAIAPRTSPSAPADLKARWLQRRKALEPALLAAFKENRGDVSKLRAVFAFAVEKAEAAEFDRALAALDNVGKLLAAAGPPQDRNGDGKANDESTSDQAFAKQWKAAQSDLKAALETVNDQLAEFGQVLMESSEANLMWIAEEGLSQVHGSLRDAAIQIDRAISKSPAKVAAKAKPAIEKLRKELQTPQVKACDGNQVGVTVTINKTIGQAIQKLEKALQLAGPSK